MTEIDKKIKYLTDRVNTLEAVGVNVSPFENYMARQGRDYCIVGMRL